MKIPITLACCLLSSNLHAQPASHRSTKDNLPGTEVPAMLFPDEMKTPNLKQMNEMLTTGRAKIITLPDLFGPSGIPLPVMLFPDEIVPKQSVKSLNVIDSLYMMPSDSTMMPLYRYLKKHTR